LAIEPVLLTTTHERPGVIVLDGLDVGGWKESESARGSKHPWSPKGGSSRIGIQRTVPMLVLVRVLVLVLALAPAMEHQWNTNVMTMARALGPRLGLTHCCSTNP
jgi:hypothetical protein